MVENPGMNGPNPVEHSGSVDDDTAASVRPQKFSLAKMMRACRVRSCNKSALVDILSS